MISCSGDRALPILPARIAEGASDAGSFKEADDADAIYERKTVRRSSPRIRSRILGCGGIASMLLMFLSQPHTLSQYA